MALWRHFSGPGRIRHRYRLSWHDYLSRFYGGQTHLAENEGKLSVYFLDVGQGDSTLFIYEGKTILIDAGEMDMGDRVVSDLRSL